MESKNGSPIALIFIIIHWILYAFLLEAVRKFEIFYSSLRNTFALLKFSDHFYSL